MFVHTLITKKEFVVTAGRNFAIFVGKRQMRCLAVITIKKKDASPSLWHLNELPARGDAADN